MLYLIFSGHRHCRSRAIELVGAGVGAEILRKVRPLMFSTGYVVELVRALRTATLSI